MHLITNRLFVRTTCLFHFPSFTTCFACRFANPDQLNNSKILIPASKAISNVTQKHLGNNKSSFVGSDERTLKIKGH